MPLSGTRQQLPFAASSAYARVGTPCCRWKGLTWYFNSVGYSMSEFPLARLVALMQKHLRIPSGGVKPRSQIDGFEEPSPHCMSAAFRVGVGPRGQPGRSGGVEGIPRHGMVGRRVD